uniref:Glycoside hydrolase family 31 TIM barrel domain-containing protein n=3 Tax=Parascaris univalens TaxID=6257 RepID=A0A915CK76_PARUN
MQSKPEDEVSRTLGCLTIESDGHRGDFRRNEAVTLRLHLGCSIEAKFVKFQQIDANLTLYFDDGVELSIDYRNDDQLYDIYDFRWTSTQAYHYMKDMIDTDSGGYWYGGGELAQQRWPLARDSNRFCPYVAGDVLKVESDPQSGMERYWLCSNKFALFIDDYIPLWTEYYDGRLSLQAQITNSLYENFFEKTSSPILRYKIFALKNERNDSLKDFHMIVHNSLYLRHDKYPDDAIIHKPIWTTWARYGKNVTQEDVLKFAKEIKDHNAAISQLELDDRWSIKYGDFEFDETKFPNVKEMCTKLNEQGIRLTLWIHPYINLDSGNAKNPRIRRLIVRKLSGEPVIVNWWNGYGYVIDFTNPEATKWFHEQLNKLKELGIFAFKFDSGEVTYLTKKFHLMNGETPSAYLNKYIEMAAEFGDAIEVR